MLAFTKRLPAKPGLLFLLFLLTGFQVFSQNIIIRGTVINASDSTPVVGASVTDLKTKKGVSTNDKGSFSFQTSTKDPIIMISRVDFQSTTVVWNGEPVIVKLEPFTSTLQDVVVVGYGTQKKINQTGSTQTVTFDEAVNQPVTNSGQLIYGRFSGVQLTQASGLPGTDASSVVIRGIGTFGSSTPLVVIDNIQYTGMEAFNNLAPADIETISVLKDASASAIYGARGANGVIVVTTKMGKAGKVSIVYNNYFGLQDVTVVPEYLGAANYARLKNEKDINANGPTAPLRYTDLEIDSIVNGMSPDRYAKTKWSDVILRSAPIQNHYLALSGGNERATYHLSLGYRTQEAVVKGKFKSDRYNLGFNVNSKLNNWLTISNVTNAYWLRFKGPAGGPGAITGETGIINQFQRSAPTVPVYYSNGEYGAVDGSYLKVNASFPITHPIRRGYLGDFVSDQINIADRIGIKVGFTKNLSFETSGSFNINYSSESNFTPTNFTYDWAGNLVQPTLVNTLSNTTGFTYRLLNENLLRFSKVFYKKHDLSVLLGHSVIYNRTDGFGGSLQGFPSNAIQEFDGGGVLNPTLTGSAAEESLQSFFGRVNYALNSKYLLEFNLRRDGSSKFGPSDRYGTFPSASAGWRIGKEKFMRNIKWISDIKLRASWGVTGNDNIGNYIFDQTYNTGLDYFLGTNTVVAAVAVTRLANPNITWETVEQYDIGLDAGFFRNKLTLGVDYFKKLSSDILYANFPLPPTIGVTNLAAKNSASMENSGLEILLNYRNKRKDFNYSIGGSLTYNIDNKVTDLGRDAAATVNSESVIRQGAPFNAYFGYQVIGIFQTIDEVNNSPRQFGSINTAPGDFKYADISGPDGKPDGIIDNRDRTLIGNPHPKFIYNFNGNFSWKGLDFTMLFEGVKDLDRILMANGQLPMEGDRNNALNYWINRWTPLNPNNKLPRLGGQNNNLVSSFYVQDASYTRLKNLEIGYTIPEKISRKYMLSKFRVFIGAQNLLTFTKMENFDPERARGTNTDQLTPLYKIYTIGVNIKLL
ncbi:MAG TPA: TonB-dependent receptor [Chitinophagaceae bacterium]|nr:TonB-dependent receptor [Chitinophagaceae bacterium]